MHIHTLEQWQHSHDFAIGHAHSEKRTRKVMLLTAVMMFVEIIAGTIYGSMALLADGWHMATHVAAFGIAVFTYQYARTHANDAKYTFGTGKVSVLGGFASAVALAVIALVMAFESVMRMFQPQAILFNQAVAVAILGLVVNLVSGLLLKARHDHAHEHSDEHEHHHHDHNLRAAYLHVLADALTSVFAIIALLAGKLFGWIWMDAIMGIVGAGVIGRWSYGLVRDTGALLLDGAVEGTTGTAVKTAIERDADNRVADLHVWDVGAHHLAATISVVTHFPRAPEHYKHLLSNIPHLSHILVEVNPCDDQPCALSPAQ